MAKGYLEGMLWTAYGSSIHIVIGRLEPVVAVAILPGGWLLANDQNKYGC